MKTKDLNPLDWDATWTPKRRLGRYGLHLDSTIWLPPRARLHQTSVQTFVERWPCSAHREVLHHHRIERSTDYGITRGGPMRLQLLHRGGNVVTGTLREVGISSFAVERVSLMRIRDALGLLKEVPAKGSARLSAPAGSPSTMRSLVSLITPRTGSAGAASLVDSRRSPIPPVSSGCAASTRFAAQA